MADDNTALLGKKIFFLHPSVFVQNEIIAELIQEEFEVYTAKNEEKLKRVLKKHPESIVFASIDEALAADKWEAWIRSVMGSEDTKAVAIGIVANTNNDDNRRLYLNKFKVPCGYIPVKSTETSKVVKAFTDILNGIEAKGRRKFIRADTSGDNMTTINLPHDSGFVNGSIRDISVVGLSCVFENDPELAKNSLFSDIQLKLQSVLIKAEGIVFGSRMDGDTKVYVFVFTKKVDPSVRAKIRTFIQKNLQTKMDNELK